MDMQFKYDWELELDAPPGGILESIHVTVRIEPPDGGCLIYGTDASGSVRHIEASGARSDLVLPFAHPKIYGLNVKGAKRVSIETRGWKDSARG